MLADKEVMAAPAPSTRKTASGAFPTPCVAVWQHS